MNFCFTNEFPRSRVDELLEYLRGPRLYLMAMDYPDHESWLHKAYGELLGGKKRAIIALNQGRIVGATIYQRHKQHPHLIELKNFTVRPDHGGRYIGSFLLRNTEIEGRRDFAGITAITMDAKASNRDFRRFVTSSHGYKVIDVQDLYGQGAGEDLIFQKVLVP
jgi:ribosomal protein S18 acetylase RimI-like enzyme